MKILITGIYGFLGSNLAKKLSQKHDVVGLYNTPKAIQLNESVTCFGRLDQINFIPDVIVMCHAAVSSGATNVDRKTLFQSNVAFTSQVLEKFPTSRIIYISSVSVFGNNFEVIDENTFVNPLTEYAISKLAGEKEMIKNPKSSIIRFSSLYGEGMKENTLIPNYCNQALQTKSIEVWGTGKRFQNYIHINDAINLIEKLLLNNPKINFPLLGVFSKEYSNEEVAKIISDLTHSEIKYINEDNSLSVRYNNELTQKVLNWYPEIELEHSLKNYLEWKKKQF